MHFPTKWMKAAVLLALAMGALCCTHGDVEPAERDVSLYAGIRGIASLGDSEHQMLHRSNSSPDRVTIGNDDSGLRDLRISHYYQFRDAGAAVYFRGGHAVMITVQEPFRGSIEGKHIKLFSFSPPQGKTWSELLVRELGEPMARASGGKFGAEALFYSWGDISYNRMGPNQLALYREADLGHYRLKNFGRELKLFANP